VLGHEVAGEVAALGAGVAGLAPGQAVGVNPPVFCGECAYCRRGQPQQCQRFRCLGNTEDGGWAEFVVIRADQAIPLDGLAPERAVWLEPLSCVLRALGPAETIKGATLLVVGAGPLGLLAVEVARAWGAAAVAVVDPNAGKLHRAEQVGAHLACRVARAGATEEGDAALSQLAPLGFEHVLETTGRAAAIERALRWAGRVSTVHLFGVSDPAERVALSPAVTRVDETGTSSAEEVATAQWVLTDLAAGGADHD
jgi:threonine dehydrogenase-like Zn-dependent dehydrogenase